MNKINKLRERFLGFILCGDVQIFDAALPENDWKTLVKWCVDHRLSYVFIKHIKQSAIWSAQADNQHVQYLARRARKAPVRQLKIQANLLHLNSILTANSIEYQILKGPILAFKYYQDSSVRRMRDIDIIVKPKSFTKVCNLLLQHGYRLNANYPEIDFEAHMRHAHHAPHLTHPDFNIVVEVHHKTISPKRILTEFDLSMHPDFWVDVSSVKLGNQLLPCESAEILLAHLILHGVRTHAFDNGPFFMFDLYFLIRNGNIDWEKFCAYRDYLKLDKEVNLAFSVLHHLYPNLNIEVEFDCCQDKKLINACKSLMLNDPEQKGYEMLASSIKSVNFFDKIIQIKNRLLPKQEVIVAHLGFSSKPYLLRLPAWWSYALRKVVLMYIGCSTKLRTSNELTMLFRWLKK